MRFKLDHIVHVTKDPLLAVEEMQSIGLNALMGGEHANWGTRNGLCHFGLPYIEFLGIQNKDIADKVTDNTLIRQLVVEQEDGFARLALRVDDINLAANYFQNLGLHVIGPVPGSRRTPDGKLLEWAMLFIEDDGPDPFHLPFIIDWKQSDDGRKQQLIDRGLVKRHRIGDITLTDVVIPTRDLKKSVGAWETLFGADIGETLVDEEQNAQCTRLTLDHQSILFCEPLGTGPLDDHLKKRGARLLRLHFSHTGLNKVMEIHGGTYVFQ